MDREGAETHLRLLAEAAMRGSRTPAPEPWEPGASRMLVVGHALTAVGALDPVTAEEILTDFNLAVSVRQLHDAPDQGPGRAITLARWLTQGRAVLHAEPFEAGTPEDDASQGRPGRFVPVGLTVPFHAGAISGELCLMSFAQTGTGARFIAAWGVRTPALEPRLGRQHPGLIPFDLFTVTDDRGATYQLDHTPGGDLEWPDEITLRPAPPEDIRWLDIAPPYRQPVRVDLRPPGGYGGAGSPPVRGVTGGSPPGGDADQAQVSATGLSPGEHLLVMLAERLLTGAPEFPRGGLLAARAAGPRRAMAAGFGDIVRALEAADVLSPLSPVPARLATLCASLDLDGHGITVPPAAVLPEAWLSLLAHYQRRKPEPAPMRDGYAPLAVALPELDGIRLALLGLLHAEESSSLYVLARGPERDHRYGPLDIDLAFPLSAWLRDGGGRWHAARSDRWHRGGRENTIRLQLVPPLTRPTARAEIIIGGQSAEVRITVPLRWEYPS